MAGDKFMAKMDAVPEDCSCTSGLPGLNLTGILTMFGCAECGGFALSLAADLDRTIAVLTQMRETLDQGGPVVHLPGRATTVSVPPR